MSMDLIPLITSAGYLGISAIIFAESGLLIGFVLPGDSLLFTAGFLASQGVLDLTVLLPLVAIAAIVGDSVGYAFGRRVGPRLFTRSDSFLFHHDHLERTHRFFERYGAKTIVLARFIPIVRTFAPILAGVGAMQYRTFLTYNVIGGLGWGVGLPLAGFSLGSAIPGIDRYLLPIVLGIILASVSPGLWHLLRSPTDRTRIAAEFRRHVGHKKREQPSTLDASPPHRIR